MLRRRRKEHVPVPVPVPVPFERAKHFKWSITPDPSSTQTNFPERVYKPGIVQVGGNIVVLADTNPEWKRTRVLFYNVTNHSWSIINGSGPVNRAGGEAHPLIAVNGEQLFILYEVPHLYCFDLVLREWITTKTHGGADVMKSRMPSVRCYMENIQSFIYWRSSDRQTLLLLGVEKLTWCEHTTKGQWPMDFGDYALSCCYGNTVYVTWRDANHLSDISLVTWRSSKFYWSRPQIRGFRPFHTLGSTLTYSAGRLFRIGGYRPLPRSVAIYSTEKERWEAVEGIEGHSASEYTMEGEMRRAASHTTIALHDKLIVFGGVSAHFMRCRFFEANEFS